MFKFLYKATYSKAAAPLRVGLWIMYRSVVNAVILLGIAGLVGVAVIFYVGCRDTWQKDDFIGIVKDKHGDRHNCINYLIVGDTDLYNVKQFYADERNLVDSINIGDTIVKRKGVDTAIVKCKNGKRFGVREEGLR